MNFDVWDDTPKKRRYTKRKKTYNKSKKATKKELD
jgi:hypothetical protein